MEPPPPSSVPAPMEAVTPEEYAAGEITDPAKLHRIRDAFLRTGVAVVQNVVPHEVLEVAGEVPRFALAGWFHEDQQPHEA